MSDVMPKPLLLGGATVGRFRIEDTGDGPRLSDALALRARLFRDGQPDRDAFDPLFRHLLIRDAESGEALATFRYRRSEGGEACGGYAAQYYDLAHLAGPKARVLELGRLGLAPTVFGPDLLRLIFACLTRIVDAAGAEVVFGCSSFSGADAARHAGALNWLWAHHPLPEPLAPRAWRAAAVPALPVSPAGLPPILRSYLDMGAGVGPDAVVDAELGTLHVFTALDVRRIAARRARALRRLAERL